MSDKKLGKRLDNPAFTFTQSELLVHEEWAHFTIASPNASALVHLLIRLAGRDDAVVASQRTLAARLGVSPQTVMRAVKAAEEAGYVEVVRLGATSTGACAYRLNSRVHWTKERNTPEYFSSFKATVVASSSEQVVAPELPKSELRKVPVIRSGEIAIANGEGKEPPSQPQLDGIPLPAVEI